MPGRWTNGSLRLVVAIVLGALIPLALVVPALAQPAPPSAELRRVIGRVEILRKGQNQWIPAVIGARLVEGDDIRAFSGAQAELAMPDASTVQLAENSRLLMTKLEYDQQQQSRLVLLHLVVGKVRAAIAQTAITLVRARQSNFAISTPTAVAAATPPRPPYREEETLPDRPRWLRVLSRAAHNALDVLDWAGDGVARLIGLRKS